MKIYTRMGDGGETGLPGGRRIGKTDAIFACLGNLDEANATIGLAIAQIEQATTSMPVKPLLDIQSTLLSIGAQIASDQPDRNPILKKLDRMTDKLESQIDAWDKQLPVLKNFILPGGTPAGATLHLCRTLIRRAERSYHELPDFKEVAIARYLNRLSDYFFQAARFANGQAGYHDQIWHP